MSNAKKTFVIFVLILLMPFIRYTFPITRLLFTNWFISPFLYAILAYITIKLLPRKKRNREVKYRRKTILILTSIYLIVFLLMGLLVGFTRNPYWGKLLMTLQEMYKIFSIIVLQEIVRNRLVTNCPKKKIYYILIVVVFYLWQVNLSDLFSKYTNIQFLFNDFAIALFIQGFLTYISFDCGLDGVLANQLVMNLVLYITPIYPDIDWFFLGMYNLIMYLIFYFIINYESVSLDRDARKGAVKKENPVIYVILLTILILLVCFQLGFFVYVPTAIVTNSMFPLFARGDAVIVKKVTKKDIQNLKVGDIIEYKYGNRSVVHRIISIDDSDEENLLFTTKGDYNNGPDALPVESNQVKGVVQFSIPYIGYPSVYFVEMWNIEAPEGIETGKE